MFSLLWSYNWKYRVIILRCMSGLLLLRRPTAYSVFGIWSRIASVPCVSLCLPVSCQHTDTSTWLTALSLWNKASRDSGSFLAPHRPLRLQTGTALKFICTIVDCIVFIRHVPVTSRPQCVQQSTLVDFYHSLKPSFLLHLTTEHRTIDFRF